MNERFPEEPLESVHPGFFWRRKWLIVGSIAILIGFGVGLRYWQYYRPESCYLRGREALNDGDYDVVRRESARLIDSSGYQRHGKLLNGLLLIQRGKLTEALTELDTLRSGSDDISVEANAGAAKCFYQLGQFLDAIDSAMAALDRDANAIDARRWLASAYYDLGAVSHAVVELEQISARAPSDPRPDRLLGLIAKDGEEYPKAIKHYEESLRRDHNQFDRENILNELAESKIKLGQFEGALETLSGCTRSVERLTLEAECQHGLGDDRNAQDLLHEALLLNSRFFPAKLVQGKLLMDIGQTEQAVLALEEAVRIEPWHSRSHYQLAQALQLLGKKDRAADELQRMNEIKSMEREFTDLHEAAMKEPTNSEIRFRIGTLAMQLGKPELAKVWFRAVLAIDPNHPRARAAIIDL